MTEVTQETELAVRLPSQSAEMAQILATVGTACVETLACCSYYERDSAVMLLITNDALKTGEVLRAASFRFTAHTVVLVRAAYEPQLAAQLGRRLAEAGISVLYSYASWSEGQHAHVVFKTTDDDRAMRLLRAEALVHDVAQEKAYRPVWQEVKHFAA